MCQSKKSITSDHSFRISLATLKKEEEDGGGSMHAREITNVDLSDPRNSYHTKRAFTQIPALDDEPICCARAIVTCIAKLEMSQKDFDHFASKKRWHLDKPNSQKGQALKLLRDVGLPSNRPIQVRELYLFETFLKTIQIIVVSGDLLNEISYSGFENRDRKIYLYLCNGHFTAITNIGFLIRGKKLCTFCYKWFSSKNDFHSCDGRCGVCRRQDCFYNPATLSKCSDCNFEVRSAMCMTSHKIQPLYVKGERKGMPKGKSLCETFYKCPKCTRVINRSKRSLSDHQCGEYFCLQCKSYVIEPHECYYRVKQQKTCSERYVYFDYECTADCLVPCTAPESPGYEPNFQPGCLECPPDGFCAQCKLCKRCSRGYCGEKQFTPNLVCAQSSCIFCEENPWSPQSECEVCGHRCEKCFKFDKNNALVPSCNNGVCGKREMIFQGRDANDKFCSWLFSKRHSGFICLAHCCKSFDGHFLLNYLVSNAQICKVTLSGCKIMKLYYPAYKITVIDSLNFLPFGLAKFQKSLGLDIGLKKSVFPHLFNTMKNQGVVLNHLPDLEFYDVDFMGAEERAELIEWHKANYDQEFDVDAQLRSYCSNDVTVLRSGCTVFKNMVRKATQIPGAEYPGISVFRESTIAGAAMATFKQLILAEYHEVTFSDNSTIEAKFKGGTWTRVLDGARLNPEDFVKTTFQWSTVAQPPGRGYRNSKLNHSFKAVTWLEYLASKNNIVIRHARRGGEKKVLTFFLDGYDELAGG